jgi:anaerobic dimethyl sulfoxide reductase subunit B
MTYAFTFDASACSGCKACQIACKDKNGLPVGVLWRRVYEISGGTWQKQGEAWTADVFAYNLSIACNHCVHPKCAGVCPTDAYVVRPDGIVYIDESKCMGCGYCAWACPYSAPQYNSDLRHMTKCNFCYDNLDAGLPPACVAACPLRVLDFAPTVENPRMIEDNQPPMVNGQDFQILWETPGKAHPFPLPVFSRTQPHLAIKPHAGMLNGLEKAISNQEEVKPPSSLRAQREAKDFLAFFALLVVNFSEFPLIIFTICGQMAAGMAFLALFDGPLTPLVLAIIAALIGIGGLASFLHLGTPQNAWRALNHLKKSWLSREILMFGVFGASWLIALLLPGMGKAPLALTGLGLVYSMAQVYRIKAVPGWNTWRTEAAFFLSAGVLGLTGIGMAVGFASVWLPLWALLAAEAWLAFSGQEKVHETAGRLRVTGSVLAMIGIGILPVVTEPVRMWLSLSMILLILAEEVLGRWLFYELKNLRVI